MSDRISCSVIIKGTFPGSSFPAWIVDRAERLNLDGSVCKRSAHCIELCLTGERVLVEAMEVACSLGPIDVQVDTIEIQHTRTCAISDRHPRQFVRYLP
jgi:acylphosphatase